MRSSIENENMVKIGLFDNLQHKYSLYASALKLLTDNSKANSGNNAKSLIILLEDKVINLNNLVGKGGSKKVYDLGDGTAIILPNVEADDFLPAMWERIVKEEVKMANKVNACGLKAQQYEVAMISVNSFPLIVIKAPSFSGMIKNGLQVRDVKRERVLSTFVIDGTLPEGYRINKLDTDLFWGSSDIFGVKENLMSADYWREILARLAEDLACYFANDLAFGEDTFNILIEDTLKTPQYSHDKRATVSDRHQQLRLFFYDFTSKAFALNDGSNYDFIDESGCIIENKIKTYVEHLLPRMTYILLEAASNAEFKTIMMKMPQFVWNTLANEAKKILDVVMPEFAAKVIEATKKKLDKMSAEERLSLFAIDASCSTAKKF